jgi:hypothetical protein
MPDITMCSGNNCPSASICYRYKATPSQRQSYFAKPPNDGVICDYFWEIETTKNK